MDGKEFMLGMVRHFPKGSAEKMKGKKVTLTGHYLNRVTGVG